jgi:ribonuclease Z
MDFSRIDWRILGCSAAIPAPGQYPSAQSIRVGGTLMLLDCGEGTQIRIREVGLRGATFDVILISHLHGDHVFGLPGLMSSWTLQGRSKPLVVVGPSGLEPFLRGVNVSTQGNWSYPVEFRVAEPGIVYQNDDVVVRSHALKHRIETWGYRIDEVVAPRKVCYERAVAAGLEHADFRSLQLGLDGRTRDGRVVPNSEVTTEGRAGFSMAYLSDTSFVPELAEFARDVEFLYHESTYLERHADLAHKTGHSTAGEAATLARLAGAKRLVLGHFSQRYGRLDDFASEALAQVQIPIAVGVSGLNPLTAFVDQ